MIARVKFTLAAWLGLACLAAWGCWNPPSGDAPPLPNRAAATDRRADEPPVEAPDPQSQQPTSPAAPPARLQLPQSGRATVVWINIDGVRGDYLSRGDFPTLHRLQQQGAASDHLVPVFPSLTFPSHVSHATGVPPSVHGIPGNAFYDRTAKQHYSYPADGKLLGAEPIWLAATRQGIRTAVLDWPLSHGQTGDVKAAYFGERFDSRLSDAQRLNQLLKVWEQDNADPPLQLLMAYMHGPDAAGHRFGPDSPEIVAALHQVDRDLADFIPQASKLWQRRRQPGDAFYLLLTTDHGMSRVDWLVHLEKLAGIEDAADVVTTSSGNVAHLFFDDPQIADRNPQRLHDMVKRVGEQPFAQAYRAADLPRQWQLAHPSRTGDIVIVLKQGYTFGRRLRELKTEATAPQGPLGMHGYDPDANPEMHGMLILWRAENPLPGVNLGKVHSLQLHATVATLLGIKPSPQSHGAAFVETHESTQPGPD